MDKSSKEILAELEACIEKNKALRKEFLLDARKLQENVRENEERLKRLAKLKRKLR
jgi:hypothetical protein